MLIGLKSWKFLLLHRSFTIEELETCYWKVFLIGFHFRDERICGGWADARNNLKCPSKVGYNWRYSEGGRSWAEAGKGLTVECISKRGSTLLKSGRSSKVFFFSQLLDCAWCQMHLSIFVPRSHSQWVHETQLWQWRCVVLDQGWRRWGAHWGTGELGQLQSGLPYGRCSTNRGQ